MKKQIALGSLLVALTATVGGAANAEGWSTYKAEKFGFSMLVPEGTKFAEKELSGGWGALLAVHDPLSLFAVGKLGDAEKPDEIQKFGVTVTGVAAEHWKMLAEGKESKGWKWYRTVKAEHAGTVVFGGYGVGAKGNYLMLLKTTAADYEAHQADYQKWYESIVLQ